MKYVGRWYIRGDSGLLYGNNKKAMRQQLRMLVDGYLEPGQSGTWYVDLDGGDTVMSGRVYRERHA